MATRASTANRGPRLAVLPSGTTAFLRKRLVELAGLALGLAGAALAVAFLSFHGGDASFNRASDGATANLLGPAGAHTADVLLRALGLAAFLLPLWLVVWAWRLVRGKALAGWVVRLGILPPTLLLVSMALAWPGAPASWPLDSALGGLVGDLLLGLAATSVGVEAWGPAAIAGLFGVAGVLYLLGVSRADWRVGGQAALRGAARALRAMPAAAAAATANLRALHKPAKPERRREPRMAEAAGRSAARPGDSEPHPDDQAAGTADDLVAARSPRVAPGKRAKSAAQRRLDLGPTGDYELPGLDLLEMPPISAREAAINRDSLEKNARLLESVLNDFGVRGEIVKVRPGPVVTRYDLEPAPGTKTSRVVGLADDIARSMSTTSVRVAVVPGSSVIGIELPNSRREVVYLRELLGATAYERAGGKLPLILGKDISGAPSIVDLVRMPHMLIAGTTGSGKSVSINVLILSLLYRLSPEDCKFIMIDPKMLELSVYDGIPHLLAPVVTEAKKAVVALKWVVREMEERYRAMSRLGVRNIEGYNARILEARRTGEVLTRRVQTGFDPDTNQPVFEDEPFDLEPLPFIVVVVDEMADLMLVAGKDIEAAVQRLAQMARAAGIHLMMATQRPSVDVITGTIKANFPTRVSFHVTSKIDSRTILGEMGAEQLLGQGDMLYMAHGGRITRVHGPLVTDQEVEDVVAHLKRQGQPSYIESVTEEEDGEFDALDSGPGTGDELYDRAVAVVCQHRKASTSFVQRHLQIGYNRAARIIEKMETDGVISSANHVGKREVLAPGAGDY